MYVSYLRWIERKFQLHSKPTGRSYRERDIFWCSLGENIGDEENGKGTEYTRPVLIIRKFNKNLFLSVPLSTKIKPDNPFYVSITLHDKAASAIISQIRVLDSKRLHKRIGTLDSTDFLQVMDKIKSIVFKNFTLTDESEGRATNVDL